MNENKWGYWIIAIILATIGFWLIVAGFVTQLADSMNYISLGYYFVAFILCGIAIILKYKCCCYPVMK